MFNYNKKSRTLLADAHWAWREILLDVVQYYDNTILDVYRGKEKQNTMFAEKASKVEYPNSKHNVYPSLAVDIAPWPIPHAWGEVDCSTRNKVIDSWLERVKFYELHAVVKFVAQVRGHTIRWGGDWNSNGDYKDQTFNDLVHYELVGLRYEKDVRLLDI